MYVQQDDGVRWKDVFEITGAVVLGLTLFGVGKMALDKTGLLEKIGVA